MSICPVCEVNTSKTICDKCGYGFENCEIVDKDRLRAYVTKLKSHDWREEVKLKKRVNEIQIKKHGRSSTDPQSGGWSVRKTSILLGESHPATSTDIRLAKKLDEYPDLSLCKNKTKAKKRLEEIERGIFNNNKNKFESEEELQEYLSNNWNQILFFKEWELRPSSISGKYNIGKIGQIDFLAKHFNKDKWLVIELKIVKSSDKAVGQILRYMGWVKEHLADKSDEIEGVIISESADELIRYALICAPNIKLKLLEKGNLILKDQNILNNLTSEQIKELKEYIERL